MEKTEKNKIWLVILGMIIFICACLLFLGIGYLSVDLLWVLQGSKTNTSIINSTLIKDCPTSWIVNEMPCINSDKTNYDCTQDQYYIYQGKRHEISEFDGDWVKANCNLHQMKVY